SMPFLNRFIGYEIFQGIQFEWKIIAGIFGIALLTGIISSVYPALIFARKKPAEVLAFKQKKETNHVRNMLIVFQYAASIILIICTAVIFNQLHFMKNKDFGFDAGNLISIPLAMPVGEGLKGSAYDVFKDELLANPDIVSVTRTLGSPMNNRANKEEMWWPGKEDGKLVQARWSSVDLDYLETLGVNLIDGQFFTYDMLSAMWDQEQTAYVVNNETVKQMGVESVVGMPIKLGGRPGKIIGVTENFNYRTLRDKLEPLCMFFQPYFHFELLVRIAPEHEQESIDYIASTWDKYAPEFPFEYEFVLDNYRHQYEIEDQTGKFMGVFGIVAIFIASIGLFGIALFSSEKRKKEIGIRKVNGAKISEVLTLLNKDFLKWVVLAFIIATPIAWYAMHKWLENFAYKTSMSWWIFAIAGVLSLGIALITVSFQSWKAATRNPVEALRYE
ncbi:MAG: FtsX-like permease family protein, partial [Prolixibacteraceae bacterium]|nr:FtsX-like permease family protein [Prolixibacteraceae bacterium]